MSLLFFYNDTATTEIYTLSLHDALPILVLIKLLPILGTISGKTVKLMVLALIYQYQDRKSGSAGMPRPISYAVFCLKKKSTGEVACTSMFWVTSPSCMVPSARVVPDKLT